MNSRLDSDPQNLGAESELFFEYLRNLTANQKTMEPMCSRCLGLGWMPKKFVSLISQNFHFRVSGIFVKHETKFGRNFRNFDKHEIYSWAKFLLFWEK